MNEGGQGKLKKSFKEKLKGRRASSNIEKAPSNILHKSRVATQESLRRLGLIKKKPVSIKPSEHPASKTPEARKMVQDMEKAAERDKKKRKDYVPPFQTPSVRPVLGKVKKTQRQQAIKKLDKKVREKI